MTAALSILHGRSFALASAGGTLPKLEAFAATQSMDATKVIILVAISITAAQIKRRSHVLLAETLAFFVSQSASLKASAVLPPIPFFEHVLEL